MTKKKLSCTLVFSLLLILSVFLGGCGSDVSDTESHSEESSIESKSGETVSVVTETEKESARETESSLIQETTTDLNSVQNSDASFIISSTKFPVRLTNIDTEIDFPPGFDEEAKKFYTEESSYEKGNKLIITIGTNGEKHYDLQKRAADSQYSDGDVSFGGFMQDDGSGNLTDISLNDDDYLTDVEMYMIGDKLYSFVSMGGLKQSYHYSEDNACRAYEPDKFIAASEDQIKSCEFARKDTFDGKEYDVYSVKLNNLKYEDIEYYIDPQTNNCEIIRAGGYHFKVEPIDSFDLPKWIQNESYTDEGEFNDQYALYMLTEISKTDYYRGYYDALQMTLSYLDLSDQEEDEFAGLYIDSQLNPSDEEKAKKVDDYLNEHFKLGQESN